MRLEASVPINPDVSLAIQRTMKQSIVRLAYLRRLKTSAVIHAEPGQVAENKGFVGRKHPCTLHPSPMLCSV